MYTFIVTKHNLQTHFLINKIPPKVKAKENGVFKTKKEVLEMITIACTEGAPPEGDEDDVRYKMQTMSYFFCGIFSI